MTSPSLHYTLDAMRRDAALHLPKARLCSDVILALFEDDVQRAMEVPLKALKAGLRGNWSVVSALQFMAGQQAAFVIQICPVDERPHLSLAHMIAKETCVGIGLVDVRSVASIDLEKLRKLAAGPE